MKKNKVILTRTGEEYTCKYLLDAADVVDTKVDMGMSGRFPQIIPYTLEEKEGQRTFVYQIGERMQMTEFLKKEINKKQMLTLLYNVLSALETFGMNMISLSYVAKDIQYIFVNPETLEVSFIVAAVDKEITDLNEVRDFVKAIICDATYFEMDRDNYVARLISFTNRRGTFSISDMKKYVDNLLLDMGIHIEEEKKQEVKENKTAADKVSRVGVMQNQAKMSQPVSPMSNGQPMPGRPMPMPNGQPMPGRPMPMPNGQPMPGRPMPMPNGQPMPGRPMPMPNGQPMPGRPMPMPNGQPMPNRPMPMQMGPDGKPVAPMPNGQPMPNRPMPMQMGPDGKPVAPMPNGQPMPNRPMPMQMGPDGKPVAPMPNGQPMPNRPMPMQMGPDGKPVAPMPNGQPMPNRPMPMQMGPDGKPVAPMPNGQPMPNRPMPMQMGPDGKPIVPPVSPMNGAAPMPEKKPEAAPVPPMPEKKPEAAPVPPMPEQKTDAPKPQAPVPYLLRTATNEKIYINKPEFAIGRSATKADYTVTDNSDVSRIHCIIERKNGVSYIKDNQSTNGTYVNGKNIAGQENVFLTNNAKVSLGDEEFVYHIR